MPSSDKEQWKQETLAPAVKRFPERRENFQTDSGLDIAPLYNPEDLNAQGLDYDNDLGYPGEFPYTRGVQPNTYRGRVWTMRQYSGYGTAAETNERFRYLLDNGQTGLSIAFDLPTQIGYDSDHLLANGEVGKVGVPICSLEDMETLFDQIPMDKVSTSMTINATASVLLCFYIVAARKQGVSMEQISGTVQNDILKEYIARGTYAYPPRPSMRLVVDLFKYCHDNVPKWNTISISGYHMREAGATAVQELAFTFSNAIAYVQAALDAGLKIDDFGPRLSFFFVAQNNLFEEVAKFRAARRMWARIMKDRFGAKDPRSMMLRFHTQTAGVSLTAQQPDNNLIRCTIQALSAILGGSQSLHVNSRDEALALPSEESVQLSLRTQQILAFESGAADVVDPLGGSYYVESLTNELEAKALDYIQQIDDMGGSVEGIEQGFQMREIGDAAYKHGQEVESGDRTIVGVNRFTAEEVPIEGLLRVNEEAAKIQIGRLEKLRNGRDYDKVKASLERLEQVAKTNDNTVPAILECVESYCTLGEISQVFRGVFGEQDGSLSF
ncbi:MAG: methylmalonyl-CoA mutase family protein [Dehalococcoidia bacterium]|nr:methylmalonyl-CoA mutase family protein [Dehalococcoidia bacterium]